MSRTSSILSIGLDAATRETLERALGSTRVRAVDSVDAARDPLAAGDFVAIVQVPESTADGLDLLRTVRERDPDIPYVLFVEAPSETFVRRALEAGATDVLRRDGPAGVTLLTNRVAHALPAAGSGDDPVPTHLESLDRINDAFFTLDREGRFTYLNDRAEELLDRPRDDLLGELATERFPEAVGTSFERECLRALEAQETITFEEHYPPLDAWFAVRIYPSQSGLSIYFRDVTDRKGRERTLELYGRIIETVDDGIYVLDPESRFMLVNEAFAEMSGYDRGELIGAPASLVRTDETGIVADELLEGMIEGERDAATVVTTLHTADGDDVPVEVRFAPFPTEDGRYGRVGIAWDITERKRLEEALRTEKEHLRVALENSPMAAARFDRDLRYTWIHDPHLNVVPAVVLGKREDELDAGEGSAELLAFKREVIERGAGERRELTLARADGTRTYDVTMEPLRDESGNVTGATMAALDITRQKRRETQLEALAQTASDLLRVDDPEAVAAVTVDAAVGGLDLPVAMVALTDGASGTLRPSATSAAADRLDAEAVLDPATGIAWEAFVASETVVGTEGVAASDGERTDYRLAALPLGEHGVLVVGTDRSDDVSTDDPTLAALLAASTEATFARILAANAVSALDRAARDRRLVEHEAQLREQNAALERVNRINDVIRRIDRALVKATTREEIERTVCSRLARAGPYALAWVGGYDAVADVVSIRERAGDGADYLDDVDPGTGDDPVGAAVRERVPTVIEDVIGDPPLPPWRREAARRGFQSIVAVPLVHHGTAYGVLCLYATETAAFDDLERTVLAELGETIGYAINAVETKRALLSDTVVELEFRIGGDDVPFVRWTAGLDGRVIFQSAVTRADGSIGVFFATEGIDPDGVRSLGGRDLSVSDVSLLDERADACLFEATVSHESFVGTLLDKGAVPRSITVEDGEATATVILSGGADVRSFIGMLKTKYPSTELIARRQRERSVRTRHGVRGEIEEVLTDRQLEVLQAAYYSGFFDSPRGRTGREVGDSLGISQPTFANHLRAAERKIFRLLLDESNDG